MNLFYHCKFFVIDISLGKIMALEGKYKAQGTFVLDTVIKYLREVISN